MARLLQPSQPVLDRKVEQCGRPKDGEQHRCQARQHEGVLVLQLLVGHGCAHGSTQDDSQQDVPQHAVLLDAPDRCLKERIFGLGIGVGELVGEQPESKPAKEQERSAKPEAQKLHNRAFEDDYQHKHHVETPRTSIRLLCSCCHVTSLGHWLKGSVCSELLYYNYYNFTIVFAYYILLYLMCDSIILLF
jgi:hypothetical protein